MANKHKRKRIQQQDEGRNHRSNTSSNASSSPPEQTLRRSERPSTQASSKAEAYSAHVVSHSDERKEGATHVQRSASMSSSSRSIVSSSSSDISSRSRRSSTLFQSPLAKQIRDASMSSAVAVSSNQLRLRVEYDASSRVSRGWSLKRELHRSNAGLLGQLLVSVGAPSPVDIFQSVPSNSHQAQANACANDMHVER